MKRKAQIIFVTLAFALILSPFLLMPFFQDQTNNEKRELASTPVFFKADGSFNVNVLSEFGDYFDDHFAFRNELITFNNAMYQKLLTSPSDSLIVGNEGWLFYSGSLDDYKRTNKLSDRALQNIANNLSLMQNYCTSLNSEFIFVCPPNKNELYPNFMPYYIVKGTDKSNWQRLKSYLDEYGVNYVDLCEVLKEDNEILYLKTDSHWNSKGAYKATEAILEDKKTLPDFNNLVTNNYLEGDLEVLINPLLPLKEKDSYVAGVNDGVGFTGKTWGFVQGSAVQDSTVKTTSNASDAQGKLLMYRDSFGNALMPYFATSFKESTFLKLVPYNFLLVEENSPDSVIVERAQRHLAYLAQTPPIMQSPTVASNDATSSDKNLDVGLVASCNGPFTILQGTLPRIYQKESVKCYLTLTDNNDNATTFEAFNTTQNLSEAFADMDNDTNSDVVLNHGEKSDYGFAFCLNSNFYDVKNCKITLSVALENEIVNIKTLVYNDLDFNED